MRTIERTENYDVVELTTNELIPILMSIEKGTFSFIEMNTVPSMNKTGNPYYNQITKITKGNILIGGKVEDDEPSTYQKRVINKTGIVDFVPEHNRVGRHVEGTCVLHNENLNRYYLQYEWFKEVLPKSEYFHDGNPIKKEIFQDFMRKVSYNKHGVFVQSVKVDNIKEIHLNHVHYVVNNEVEVEV